MANGPEKLRKAMEKYWRNAPCRDPHKPCCWDYEDRFGKPTTLFLRPDIDPLVADEDDN